MSGGDTVQSTVDPVVEDDGLVCEEKSRTPTVRVCGSKWTKEQVNVCTPVYMCVCVCVGLTVYVTVYEYTCETPVEEDRGSDGMGAGRRSRFGVIERNQ